MKIKKIFAVLAAMTALTAAFNGCNKDSDKSSSDKSSSQAETEAEAPTDTSEPTTESAEPTGDNTIKWLSYYDLNPSGGNERSIALTLFEDVYGGKVEWIPTTNDTKYDDLSKMVLGGEEVDMFPFEADAVPKGVSENLYQPLDEYINFDDELWADMKETADKLQYKGQHYVIPYSIEDPICIIYSRKMVKDAELDDPAELYKQGKWDWDSFMSMMKEFNEQQSDRYGCTGWIGQAMVQSTGQSIVNYDGTKFTNNLTNPDIEKAELLLEELSRANLWLYNGAWWTNFPDDESTLFYAMAPWALEESNALNPDGDLFIVPFPKMPGADKYYTCCSFGAKMLVAGSNKGEAVAKYIECERIAATDENYTAAAKELALKPTLNIAGEKTRFITSEQWDMIHSLKDPTNISPVYDYGFGMGKAMSGDSTNYESRGALRNITDALITNYDGAPSSWEDLRDSLIKTVDDEIGKYN